jgi:hypothetical protein
MRTLQPMLLTVLLAACGASQPAFVQVPRSFTSGGRPRAEWKEPAVLCHDRSGRVVPKLEIGTVPDDLVERANRVEWEPLRIHGMPVAYCAAASAPDVSIDPSQGTGTTIESGGGRPDLPPELAGRLRSAGHRRVKLGAVISVNEDGRVTGVKMEHPDLTPADQAYFRERLGARRYRPLEIGDGRVPFTVYEVLDYLL